MEIMGGIKVNGKSTMTNAQREILTERYAETRTETLAQEFGVSYRTVCRWAAQLGLEKSQEFRTGLSAIAGVKCRRSAGQKVYIILDDEKRAYMRQHFATTPNAVLAKQLDVNERTIRRWSVVLGLKKDREEIELHRRAIMSPTPEQRFLTVGTIRELYPDGRDQEISDITGYSVPYIQNIARKYGIQRSEAYRQRVKEKMAKAHQKRRGTKAQRTRELEATIRQMYADTPTIDIAKQLGISDVYVKIIAHRIGLKKSREFVQNVRRIAHLKREEKKFNKLTI